MTVTGTPVAGDSTWSSPTSWRHHSLGTSGSAEVERWAKETRRRSGSTRARRCSARSAATPPAARAPATRHTFSAGETRRALAARSSGERPPPGSDSWTRTAAPGCGGVAVRAAGCANPIAAATGAIARAARMTPMVKRRPFKPTKESTIAYIGLGANLGERERTIAEALRRIDNADRISLLRATGPIETDPVGYKDQPRFLNAAASLATTYSPRELLDLLLEIERDLGRIRGRGPRYGPRTIDLDLLLYGDERIDVETLEVCHPRLHERRFVLEPLAELDPALVVPGRGPVSALLAELE